MNRAPPLPGSGTSLDARWLYQRDDQVFGPVAAREILQMLYEGDLDFESLIAPEGRDFSPVDRFSMFAAHRPKVELERRRALEEERRRRAEASVRLKRRLLWTLGAVLLASAGGIAVQLVLEYQRSSELRAARAAAEARLQAELAALSERVILEPPLRALPTPPEPQSRRRGRRQASRRPPARQELDDAAVLGRMGDALPRFKSCIVAQIQRDPESVEGQITLTFAIGNDGVARGLAVRERALRGSRMVPCFERVLASVRWPAFRGEVRNVEYPIKVGRS